MPRAQRDEIRRYRFAASGAFWALFLIACIALGIAMVIYGVEQYRWHQSVRADFAARMPTMMGEAPYDPMAGKRLIGEVAGCAVFIVVFIFMIRGRRHERVQVRVKWTTAPHRIEPIKVVRAGAQDAARYRVGQPRKNKSGSLAADRLAVIVWSDHVARLGKERA